MRISQASVAAWAENSITLDPTRKASADMLYADYASYCEVVLGCEPYNKIAWGSKLSLCNERFKPFISTMPGHTQTMRLRRVKLTETPMADRGRPPVEVIFPPKPVKEPKPPRLPKVVVVKPPKPPKPPKVVVVKPPKPAPPPKPQPVPKPVSVAKPAPRVPVPLKEENLEPALVALLKEFKSDPPVMATVVAVVPGHVAKVPPVPRSPFKLSIHDRNPEGAWNDHYWVDGFVYPCPLRRAYSMALMDKHDRIWVWPTWTWNECIPVAHDGYVEFHRFGPHIQAAHEIIQDCLSNLNLGEGGPIAGPWCSQNPGWLVAPGVAAGQVLSLMPGHHHLYWRDQEAFWPDRTGLPHIPGGGEFPDEFYKVWCARADWLFKSLRPRPDSVLPPDNFHALSIRAAKVKRDTQLQNKRTRFRAKNARKLERKD